MFKTRIVASPLVDVALSRVRPGGGDDSHMCLAVILSSLTLVVFFIKATRPNQKDLPRTHLFVSRRVGSELSNRSKLRLSARCVHQRCGHCERTW